jgi:glycosyltransferase involved in cell wall biosynthesis
MKIILIHHQYALSGGMENYLQTLLYGLTNAGHKISLWVNKAEPQLPVPEGVELHIARAAFLPEFLQKYYFAWVLTQKLKKTHADIIISTTRTCYQDITITGGTHKPYLKQRKRWRLKDFFELYLEKCAYKNSRYVIAHSPSIAAELKNFYQLTSDKIKMLYPPIDTKKFKYTPRERKPGQAFRLLFPSNAHKRKGGYLLLEALKLLPQHEVELWIAGKPFAEAEKLPQVKYLGFVKDLATVYPEVDLTVLPSFFEPFGLVVIESLESGTPVLISKHTGAKDLITADEGLILETMTPEALASLLRSAQRYNFKVAPNFALRHGLTAEIHIKALLDLCTSYTKSISSHDSL